MEIHLIRHTAVDNPENLCYGFADIPLKENYQEDFKTILTDHDFDLVVSSPALRCRLLADHFNYDYKTDDRLREMNFGNWELKKWSDIPEEEINPWYDDFVNVKAKGGENLHEMQIRVHSFWYELALKKNINKVLIITHAGVIRLILQAVLQFPLDKIFSIQIDYGKKVIIEGKDGYYSVKNLNI